MCRYVEFLFSWSSLSKNIKSTDKIFTSTFRYCSSSFIIFQNPVIDSIKFSIQKWLFKQYEVTLSFAFSPLVYKILCTFLYLFSINTSAIRRFWSCTFSTIIGTFWNENIEISYTPWLIICRFIKISGNVKGCFICCMNCINFNLCK